MAYTTTGVAVGGDIEETATLSTMMSHDGLPIHQVLSIEKCVEGFIV